MQRRDKRTVFKHTLLNILALSKIDKRLDKRETADDLLTQRIELRSRLSLRKPQTEQVKRIGIARWGLASVGKMAYPPLRRAAPHAAESPSRRPRGPAAPRPV